MLFFSGSITNITLQSYFIMQKLERKTTSQKESDEKNMTCEEKTTGTLKERGTELG